MSPRLPLSTTRPRALSRAADTTHTPPRAAAEPTWDDVEAMDQPWPSTPDQAINPDEALEHTHPDDLLSPPCGPIDGPDSPDGNPLTAAGTARSPAPAEESQLVAWIAGVVVHDESALAALHDHTARRVHSLVLRITRCPALAEEVVEDTFFQVWRQAVRFDPARGRAMTWLLAMARSRAIDTMRREARNQHQALDDGAETETEAAWGDPGPAADDLLAVARSHAELHRAMLLLNAQPRQLVALAFLRGLSHEEIASTTALPLGTVKSQIRRALGTLKQLLSEKPLAAPIR